MGRVRRVYANREGLKIREVWVSDPLIQQRLREGATLFIPGQRQSPNATRATAVAHRIWATASPRRGAPPLRGRRKGRRGGLGWG
ncbi:UNVERIFIED_CONTAM: hypothetical protein Slati_4045000 [Sesamum latifolium]|uniref:Uncharacterized protein n=1 Tax=Sesamum latifolium TaxID=2727402 RepID=A0AAW2TV56_9LAMI